MTDKPTVEQVLRLREEWEAVHKSAWATMQDGEDLYRGNYTVVTGEKPPDLAEYHPSGPRTRVNRFTDYIIPYRPRVHVEPQSRKGVDKRRANVLETAASEFWAGLTGANAIHPIREAAKFAAVRGKWCLKGLMLDPEYSYDEPKKTRKEGKAAYERRLASWKRRRANIFPFSLLAIDPMYRVIHPISDKMTPRWVLEVYPLDIEEAQLVYPHWEPSASDLKNLAPANQVEVAEYWHDDYRMVLIEKAAVPLEDEEGNVEEVVPNILGRVPYRMGYLGYGLSTNSVRGKDANTAEAARCVSMIGSVSDDILREARAVTAENQHFNRFINAHLQTDTDDYGKAQDQWHAHEMVHVSKGAAVRPVEIPPFPQFGKEAKEDARAAQEFGMVANVLLGYNPSAVTVGFQLMQLREDAGRIFLHTKETLRAAMSQMLQDWVYLNKHILPLVSKAAQQPLFDTWKDESGAETSYRMRWTEVEDDTLFEVIFPNEDKTADAQASDISLQWLREGAMSRAYALERGGKVQDSENVVFEADVDTALKGLMPAVVQEGAALFQVKAMLADVQEAERSLTPAGIPQVAGIPAGGPAMGVPIPPAAPGSPEESAMMQQQMVEGPPLPPEGTVPVG